MQAKQTMPKNILMGRQVNSYRVYLMIKRKNILGVFIFVAFLGLTGCTLNMPAGHSMQDGEVHIHASFRVVVDGEVQDYSGDAFMQVVPCVVDPDNPPPKDLTDPKERIHLHNNLGTVAHIHAAGVTWRELFVSLELEALLEQGVTVFDKDANSIEQGLDDVINNREQVVFVVGEALSKEEVLRHVVPLDDIFLAESQVEACGILK